MFVIAINKKRTPLLLARNNGALLTLNKLHRFLHVEDA
jgi:hypothetical protein